MSLIIIYCQAQFQLVNTAELSLALRLIISAPTKPHQPTLILSQPQRQENTTQPQHCSWVGHENDFANPTHPTAQTQQKPSGASD